MEMHSTRSLYEIHGIALGRGAGRYGAGSHGVPSHGSSLS